MVNLVVITAYSPRDISKWSGTSYFLYDAIERSQKFRVTYVRGALALCDIMARKIINNICKRVLKRDIDCRFSTLYARVTGTYVTMALWFVRPGALLIVAGSQFAPYIQTRRPIIYVSDTTFRLISRLYSDFERFPKWLKQQADKNEAISLSKVQHVIYPSTWAAQSARDDYGVPSDHIHQVPFGPNITDDYIRRFFQRKTIDPRSEVKILFVAADWKRKNGDIVIETCRLLRQSGMSVRSILIGNIPESVRTLPFVDYRGSLNKSKPDEIEKLCQAYREAHFLLLPTTAEAFGIVFTEAQAFGVPPITYEVGGTGSAISHELTGLLMPLGTTPQGFATAIMHYISNPSLYDQMAGRCVDWYHQRANWARWSELIADLAVLKDDPLRRRGAGTKPA